MKPAPQDHGLEGFKGSDPNSPFRIWLREYMEAEIERRFVEAYLYGTGTIRPKGIK